MCMKKYVIRVQLSKNTSKYGFLPNINLSRDGTEVTKACLIDIRDTLDLLMVTNVSPNFILETSHHPP